MEIEGVMDVVVFHNSDNGYTVGRLVTEDGDITVVGNALLIQEKENYRMDGELIYHPKYGEQFQFHKIEVIRPRERTAVIGYLSSGLLPNVGKKTAKRIVDCFGDETMDILEKTPQRLLEVEGIGKKRIQGIIEAFEEQKDLREFMLYSQEIGLSSNLAMRVFKKYGELAEAVIRENPYRLADDIRGIGFQRADKIALEMGFDRESNFRIVSGMKYVIHRAVADGHTYLPEEDVVEQSCQILGLPEEIIRQEMVSLAIDSTMYITKFEDRVCCYPIRLYQAENAVSAKLLQRVKKPIARAMAESIFENLEKELPHALEAKQKEAVEKSLNSGVLVITGGPGTGKTTTLKAIVHCMEELGLKVALAAPTGRAAKRMEEATKREAKTIHRLLQFEYIDEDGFENSRTVEEKIEADVIIVDEASMIDIVLMKDLLLSMEEDARLILVGDVDQLPSVGAGNVLRDIISSGKIPVVHLNKIFRQEETSMIIENAHLINEGKFPMLNQKGGDFFFMEQPSHENTATLVADLVKRRLPDHYGVDPFEDIQVLTPMRKGICGVEQLNQTLQRVLNPKSDKGELTWNDFIYRVDDKVMQIKNDYKLQWEGLSSIFEFEGEGVFNGDMGRVYEIDEEENEVKVLYEEYRLVTYTKENLDLIQPAYATTIHKSQGSEFPIVVIPVVSGPPMLLTRNLIYTGITRAKDLVVLVGNPRVLAQMVSNNQIVKRYSSLDRLLKEQGGLYE